MMGKYQIDIVELEITNACAHRCPYCYLGDISAPQAVRFSDFNILCQIIDKLNEYGVKMIALLGGDPVLHPRIMDIMRYIKSTSNIKVSIMSNTLAFDKSLSIKELSGLIDNIDFTLHGKTAGEHELFCHAREGLYNEIMLKLQEYINYGTNVNIAINLIPSTFNNIYKMVKAVRDNGVCFTTLLLQRIIPLGRAQGTDSFNLTKRQVHEALLQIEQCENEFNIDISFEDPYPLCCIDKRFFRYMKGCPEGINRLPVKGDGGISLCGVSSETDIGNILTDSYETIWERNEHYIEFRTAAFLTNSECKNCGYRNLCRGGCPIQYIMGEKSGKGFKAKFLDD